MPPMPNVSKLTEAQRRRLTEIRDYKPGISGFAHPGFWSRSRVDQALLARGMIETDTIVARGFGAIHASFSVCRLTPAGRLALEQEGEPS